MASAWKTKLQASLQANAGLVYSKYAQLATVRLDGRPANRTVVFRGFLGDGDELTFVTDKRSQKVAEVGNNPAVELCWYFPESREQYRISGTLAAVGADHEDQKLAAARQAAWDAMSPSGRLQFGWPQPGLPRTPDPLAFKQPVPGSGESPLPTFMLLILRPSHVDYVQLFDNYRCTFSQHDNWQQHDVNP